MESLEVICCFQAASDWPGAGPDADIAVQCEMLVGSGDTIWKIRAWKKKYKNRVSFRDVVERWRFAWVGSKPYEGDKRPSNRVMQGWKGLGKRRWQ